MNATSPRAVFLDRDGVVIEDVHLLIKASEIRILPGAPEAVKRLRDAGFHIFVVSNQPVVARGLVTEAEVKTVNDELNRQLIAVTGAGADQFYFCPHHPKATVPAYRVDCACRKPRPGMLLQAAREHGVDLAASFMVGDRITDIIAGAKAGCRTVQVQTGQHDAEPIQSSEPIDFNIRPGWTCGTLAEAADWIIQNK